MSLTDFFKPEKPIMKVCMMGPTAVGKTTVLTAVFNETQTSILGTSLNLTAKGETNAALTERLRMLKVIFARKVEISDNSDKSPELIASSGMVATSHESTFEFAFGHLGKEPIIDIMIKDFPGEDVVKKKNDVIEFIKESQCVFIAIDTPHMMEREGEFNEIKNKPKQITELFESAVGSIDSEKLILFIPLKCEKYFHENRMGEVRAKVEKVYGDLIKLLSDTGKVCCCVSPIQTLGNVEFNDFTYDENGNVLLAPDNCPADVQYKYVGAGKYEPFFCQQPLYSLLLFVAAQYKRLSKRMGLIDMLKNLLWKTFHSDEALFDDILKMKRNRISDNEKFGYKTLCGRELFECD